MRKSILFIAVLFIILLQACSSIEKEHAESIAKEFVKHNVRFFSKNEETTIDLSVFMITSIRSHKEGGLWVVDMHVEAQIKNETKKNDVTVKINNKGEVVEFNGKKIISKI